MDQEDESSVKNCQRAMRYMYKLTLKDKNLGETETRFEFSDEIKSS